MKAVIVDLLHEQAAALCDDGRVVKLADAGYTLGQIVEIHEQKRHRPKWTRMIASVAAAAVLLMGVGSAAYAMPYGVVSLDVNPSIEYTINCFRYVLSVEGVNDAGKAVLAEMDSSRLIHHRIDDALEESLTQIEAGDWLTESSPDVLLAAGLGTEPRSEMLVQELASELQADHGNLAFHALAVSREDIDAAREAGMSAGRQHMLREFGEREGTEAVPEDWADRPIGDLLHAFETGHPNPEQQLEAQEQHDMPNQEHAEQREEQTQPPQDETRQQPPAQEMPQSEDSLHGAGGTASREQPGDFSQAEPRQERPAFDGVGQEPPAAPTGGMGFNADVGSMDFGFGGQTFGSGNGFGGSPGAPGGGGFAS